MKWKILLVLGAAAGGVVWAAHRKTQKAAADARLWAEATDPVVRFGNS